jgi:1-acyl-sn-glycerol-3-phosphate acyltransferase
MPTLRAAVIVTAFVLFTLPLMPLQWLLVKLGSPWAGTFPNWYHRRLAQLFGVRLTIKGTPVRGEGVLIVANHTSWLDIVIFSALQPISFVAKAEIAGWPFFGTLARLQRTVFVERARRAATGDARDAIRERLLAGDCLVLFPEGTSHDGNSILPFKSALLGAAEATLADGRHVKVQPVTAAFVGVHGLPMGRENRPAFAWYGDMELVPHLWEALLAGPLDVVVQFHEPLSLDIMDRKTLARQAEALVRTGLAEALAGEVA